MKKIMDQVVLVAVAVALLFTTACGTIMHPERKGQVKGDLDMDIVVRNALFLLLGVVPGVVAFVVDYSTNALYLPADDLSVLPEDLSGMRVVFIEGEMTESAILQVLQKETGRSIETAQITWETLEN